MSQKNERLAESVENAREFMQTSLEGIEKVARLQLDSSKKILKETSEAIKEISSASNPKDFFNRLGQLATNSVESSISNCHDLYQIMSEIQSNVGKLIEANIQNTQHNIANAVEGLSKYNPANNTKMAASASVQNWLAKANQAMDNMQKMASQITDFTNKSIKAAQTGKTSTAKKTTTKK